MTRSIAAPRRRQGVGASTSASIREIEPRRLRGVADLGERGSSCSSSIQLVPEAASLVAAIPTDDRPARPAATGVAGYSPSCASARLQPNSKGAPNAVCRASLGFMPTPTTPAPTWPGCRSYGDDHQRLLRGAAIAFACILGWVAVAFAAAPATSRRRGGLTAAHATYASGADRGAAVCRLLPGQLGPGGLRRVDDGSGDTGSRSDHSDNHGTAVSTVAKDHSTTGKAHGAAVSAAAKTNAQSSAWRPEQLAPTVRRFPRSLRTPQRLARRTAKPSRRVTQDEHHQLRLRHRIDSVLTPPGQDCLNRPPRSPSSGAARFVARGDPPDGSAGERRRRRVSVGGGHGRRAARPCPYTAGQ